MLHQDREMPKRRAVVEVSRLNKSKARLWGYGYADLSVLLGVSEGALRGRAARGTLGFDPGDLLAVARLVVEKRGML